MRAARSRGVDAGHGDLRKPAGKPYEHEENRGDCERCERARDLAGNAYPPIAD